MGGGGVFGLGNREWRDGGGPQAVLKFQVEGVGSKKLLSIGGGGWIFSGITHSTCFSFTYLTKEMVNSSMCHIG